MIEARFDDLTPGSERSYRFVEPVGVVEAHRPDEIVPALTAVEAATSRGLWAAGFIAYEAAPGFDPAFVVRPRPSRDPFADFPLLWFAMFESREEIASPEAGSSAPAQPGSAWRPSIDRDTYDLAIARIRDHIKAGDTYQVNFTLRLRATIRGEERDFYRDLCVAQRAARCAYLNVGRYRVLSASPELFFEVDGDRITTRPMKGTAARGRWPAEDEAAADRLAASPKERAENAMIVDLLRNDLGRIAPPGSVRVERMFEAERYETVWQLTSTIVARLEPGTRLTDMFRALFPSGSVTGAPKVRTMQIIAALEDSPRGVYTGTIGFLSPRDAPGPRAMFNVAIRTVVLDTQTGLAEYGVGGGITHDSVAAAEYEEVLAKARVLSERRTPFELLETLRYEPDQGLVFLAKHLDRLAASARYFGFACDRNGAIEALEKAVADLEGGLWRVRLTLARGGNTRVTSAKQVEKPGEPIRVALDDEPIDAHDVLVFHKTTHREPYERRAAQHPDADDVVLVNGRGEVTESTIANIAVKIGGWWFTPPLESGCLPGIYRGVLLREGRLAERAITVAELVSAEELALVNSVRLWRPAVLVG